MQSVGVRVCMCTACVRHWPPPPRGRSFTYLPAYLVLTYVPTYLLACLHVPTYLPA